MTADKRKKGFSTYILPILFCGLLIVLALLRGRPTEQPVKAVLQEGEPLTLTEQALENYLYSAGFTLQGETVLNESGQKAATLTLSRDDERAIREMVLTFRLPTYIPTEDDEGLASLKAEHDGAVQQYTEMFLSLFDAISATDNRVGNRRDSAVEKLTTTLNTGKASVQAANSWQFSFSLEPGEIESSATILFTLVKE